MKNRLFTAVVFAASLAAGIPAGAVVIDPAALTTSDHYATDDTGKHFYYDLYKITNIAGEKLKLRITMDPGDNLLPFLGYTYNLGALPSANWDSGSPTAYDALETMSTTVRGETIGMDGVFSPFVQDFLAGSSVLLAVTMNDYIEDPGPHLDTYKLIITGEKYPADVGEGCGDCIGRLDATFFTDATLSVVEILPGAVPAPFTPALMLAGLAGLTLTRRRKTA